MTPKPSVLLFKEVRFLRVSIEADFDFEPNSTDFDFEGAKVGFSIDHGRHEDGNWTVAVGFRTTNEKAKVLCPYIIDVQAMGVFSIDARLDAEKQEKVIYENGAALVYGAIRELVSNISSRSAFGPVMLPTPTFSGAFEEYLAEKLEEENARAATKPKTLRKSKSQRQHVLIK
jgi:preprotein translocase subunit SecB